MNRVFASAAIAATVLVSQAFADSITMNDGQIVEKATVLKIGIREVEYNVGKKKVIYAVRKADVAKITYKDGTVETFPIREKPDCGKGERFGKSKWGKAPGSGLVKPERNYRGEPGEFRGREDFGGPDRDASGAYRHDGKPIGRPGERPRDNDVPQPPQGATLTAPAQPAPTSIAQSAPAQPAPAPATQPAKTQAAPAPAQPAPAATQPTPAPAAQPAPATQPAKTQSAPAPAQPAPAR